MVKAYFLAAQEFSYKAHLRHQALPEKKNILFPISDTHSIVLSPKDGYQRPQGRHLDKPKKHALGVRTTGSVLGDTELRSTVHTILVLRIHSELIDSSREIYRHSSGNTLRSIQAPSRQNCLSTEHSRVQSLQNSNPRSNYRS
jgi:hypothetical protein